MNKLYMGIDVGTVCIKGIIIDEFNNIITSCNLYSNGDIIESVKKLINCMKKDINLDSNQIVAIGVTGAYKKLVSTLFFNSVTCNSIVANSIGIRELYPYAETIFEIGGNDSKIIIMKDGKVVDYKINTACMAGIGSFIDNIANRLNVKIDKVSEFAFISKNKLELVNNCSVFLETDIMNKIKQGYNKNDIIAGLCCEIANNYIDVFTKNIYLSDNILFIGGVSNNKYIVKKMGELTEKNIIVPNNSDLIGALGVAVMAKKGNKRNVFDFNIDNLNISTELIKCNKCSLGCEIVNVCRNNIVIDQYGYKCNLIKNM